MQRKQIMQTIHALFVHSSLKYFSGKTNKFIRYWNELHKAEFRISVLALDPEKSAKKYQKNKLEIEIEKFKIPVYSIKDIEKKKLKETLISIAPDIVIMYDDSFLMNAAVTSSCRISSIPTLYVQHGLYSEEPLRTKLSIKEYLKKFLKYRLFLSFYIKSVGFKPFKYAKLFLKLMKMCFYNESVNPKVKIDDFHCDYAAVWNQVNKQLAIFSKGYNKENIFIVGNPDGNNDFSKSFSYNYLSKNVLYVAQPLVEQDVILKQEFINWSKELINNLPEDIKLIVRPHPKSDVGFLKKCFPGAMITLNEEIEIRFVVGHFSTYNLKLSSVVPTILVYFDNTFRYTNNELFSEIKKISYSEIYLLINLLCADRDSTELLTKQLQPEYLSDFYKETTLSIQNIVMSAVITPLNEMKPC